MASPLTTMGAPCDQLPGPVVLAATAVSVGIALVTFTLLDATIGVGRASGLEEETSR